jgi:uncharacterized protein YqjF (DUF2071 family)
MPHTHHVALDRLGHRPWPIPGRDWMWRQTWHDLLFAHWQVDGALLRPLIPPSLTIDTHDGRAWLGLVPFHMSGVALRGAPAVPWLSAFAEMNLRTYITFEDKPGVWFFRMDAARLPAVLAARVSLGLPYVWSTMRVGIHGERIDYSSRRGEAIFEGTYGPVGPTFASQPNSLEAFLTERYCLYTMTRGRLWRVEVVHERWPLQPATLDVRANTIAAVQGLPASDEPLLHFSKRLDVVGWDAEAVR